ncbi:hypothetical protein TSOC_003520 [Tetrabaena socialis]|uniref:Uncharacterized protein n=1 Tax=Tetrabaena socialis TaxID=47790 RepID=A0A2J8ABC6_9CHLO|nr:hypothetical protein TSOC_003520 [Tetrabaena socialis]|eukprot:PNH09807.1 hypothetical protein TSOC_003520 [Tetrabaena socialis]
MPRRPDASPSALPPLPPPPQPPPPPPLAFDRWFARRARACDLLLLLLEVLTVNAAHVSQLMSGRVCVPVGGGPHAALQELPLHPDLHRTCALLGAFPCGASYAGRLLYVLRTGAAFDPRVALRLTDYGLLGLMLGQLASLAVLLASPWLYGRTRRGLVFVQSAAVLLGCLASAAWTSAALLPLVSAAFLGARRRRMGAAFFAWKAATADRVPSWLQLLYGPALWLLAVMTTHLLDRRLLPPGASQPQHLQAPHAALLFVVMAVLPYLAGRCYKRALLRPQYNAYLLDCGGASICVGGSGGRTRNASNDGSIGEHSSGGGGGGSSGSNKGDSSSGGGTLASSAAGGSGGGGVGQSNLRCRGSSSAGGGIKAEGSSGCAMQLGTCPDAAVAQPSRTPDLPLRSSNGAVARTQAEGGGSGGPAAAIGPIPPLPNAGRSPLYRSGRGGAVQLISGKVGLPEGRHTSGGLSFEATATLAENAAVAAGDGRGSSGEIHHARIEEEEAAFGGLGAAVEPASRLLLTDASKDADGAGSNALSTFAWPPVMPLSAGPGQPLASAARGAQQPQPGGVLALLPTSSLAGLNAVRCVVAGPASQPRQRQHVHLDVTIAIARTHTGSAEGGGYTALRLQLPPAALHAPGTLAVFVLPSSSAEAALEAPSAADAAPLAALPLLALPEPAAAEVRQLYGNALGDEQVYGSLQQLLLEGRAADGGPDCWRLTASAAAAAATASAAIQQGGLTSLSYDIAALLQLPVVTGEGALEDVAGDGPGNEAPQLPFHALPSAEVLRFLASQRMGACLREGLRALRRAGMRLTGNGQAPGNGEVAVEAAALQLIREAAGEAGAVGVMGSNKQPPSQLDPELPPSANESRPGASPPPPARGGGTPPTLVRRSGISGRSGAAAGPSDQPTPSTAHGAPISSSHPPSRSARPWNLSLGKTLRWWLRALLLGFSAPGQERSYQAFKAARCWRVNLMAFGLMVGARLAACLRTLRAVQAETVPVPAADGIGAGRLTELQQQLLAQAFFVAGAFLVAALALGTPPLRRHRTALLLMYKALLDPLSFCLVMWPSTWGGPLLRTPDAWMDGCRHYGLHWLYQSLLIPALLQLSPLHQLWTALANLLPMTLYGYHIYRGRWAPALGFGAGDAVLGLAISSAADFMTRRLFMRCNAQPDKAD